MTENKLYQLCREEALKQFKRELKPSIDTMELSQLTAEIYGMKLLELAETKVVYNPFQKSWITMDAIEIIGTTQQLHDHFVEQFNVSLTNEGNNSKQ